MRNASAHKPCSATEHARGSAGDTHALRDGDEADADEREQAAAMPAESGEGLQLGQSRLPWLTKSLHLCQIRGVLPGLGVEIRAEAAD